MIGSSASIRSPLLTQDICVRDAKPAHPPPGQESQASACEAPDHEDDLPPAGSLDLM